MKELHLFILWENARFLESKILKDIASNFTIIKCFEITWDKEYVSQNFTRFYGVNLPDNSIKEQECGSGSFLLITLYDNNPQYDYRDTSRGKEYVNTNLFDAKSQYREWTGGGHKIHATNNPQECNHDITLLLGLNSHDFLQKYGQRYSISVESIHKNIIGFNGWSSIKKLFYVLNNTINYVILRGKNELIEQTFTDVHRDIDILIDNTQNAQYIINGKSVYSLSRPHELININGFDYYLDLWDINRHYFDRKWSLNLLATKQLINGIYILDPQNDFYILLYHCLIIKKYISPDYLPILLKHKQENQIKEKKWENILLDFLSKQRYDIVIPNDDSIKINFTGQLKAYANKYGKLVKTLESIGLNNTLSYTSKVYEKEKSFVKVGSSFLIDNEYKYLKELSNYPYFPKILNYKSINGYSSLEITRIEGVNFRIFFSNKKYNKIKYIKSFILECFKILKILNNHNIIHRDFIPSNIFIKDNNGKCEVRLIDFGWAINTTNLNNCLHPKHLGDKYAPTEGYSDYHTFGSLLYERWEFLSYITELSTSLKQINKEDYLNKEVFKSKIYNCIKIATKKISLRDYRRLLLIRYPQIQKLRIFLRLI